MRSDQNKKHRLSNRAILIAIAAALVCVAGSTAITFALGDTGTKLPDVSAKKSITSPLTGQVSDEALPARPLMVSIDNVGDAIPQSNLSHADIIYEVPVEWQLTRLEGIFYSDFPEFYGPIRSCRPYIIDIAREYKTVFLAYGWSRSARLYLEKGYIPWINGMKTELNFYRVSDKAAPHNAYIEWKEVKGKIDHEGWWDEKQKIRSFKFLSGNQKNDGKSIQEVSFKYPYSNCEFTYDAGTGKYKRSISGADYIDKETGQAIEVDNVLVQEVTSRVYDQKKGRLKINMTKGGKAMLFTGGVMVKGTWSKKDLDSRTIFKDQDGNEFKLTPGKTWVEVADQNCTITY